MRTLNFTLIVTFLLASFSSFATGSITSTSGYTVEIDIMVKSIESTSSSCRWGYNYNVTYEYDIRFTGRNIPKELYTLQGNLYCGNNSHFMPLPNSPETGDDVTTSNVWRGESDCDKATTSSLDCDVIVIEIAGPGISRQQFKMSAGALPVKFANVSADKENDLVTVNWSTLTEINNEKFTIERSYDGQQFETIGEVAGAGNSNAILNYQFEDMNAPNGVIYYRVKQTDFDGKFDYSRTIVVNNNTEDGRVNVYPNPNRNTSATIQLGYTTQPRTVRIMDMSGKMVHEFTSNASQAQLPSLRTGVYVIQVIQLNGKTNSTRFIQE